MWIQKQIGDLNSHTHSNKPLLDLLNVEVGKLTYNGVIVDTTDINSHTHTNKSLLDLLSVVNGKLYYNGIIIDTTDPNSHTHPNKSLLDLLSIVNGKLYYNGVQVDTTGSGTATEILAGKRVGIIGSSTADPSRTQEFNFWEYIQQQTGCTIVDYADSGSFLTSTIVDYTQDTTNQLLRIDQMPIDVDIAMIMPVMNDAENNRPIGVWADTNAMTVYGALHMMCQKLIQKFPMKPVGVMTGQFIGTIGTGSAGFTSRSSAYQDAVKEVCAYYGIPVKDLHAEGRTPFGYDWFFQNYVQTANGHLTNNGNIILARSVVPFVRTLLSGVI